MNMLSRFLRKVFLFPVAVYKYCISPMLGPAKCRYSPSCSSYFETSVMRFGILKGTLMGLARIMRCSRFFIGGPDEVPDTWSWKAITDGYRIYRKPGKGKVSRKN